MGVTPVVVRRRPARPVPLATRVIVRVCRASALYSTRADETHAISLRGQATIFSAHRGAREAEQRPASATLGSSYRMDGLASVVTAIQVKGVVGRSTHAPDRSCPATIAGPEVDITDGGSAFYIVSAN